MNAAASQTIEVGPDGCPHPNDVDRKRIERALAGRERYRYVTPAVQPEERGYRIESPCCSRNIDEHGGTIDIARLEFVAAGRCWLLYRRNHALRTWEYFAEYASLAALLHELNQDRRRVFWQ